MIRDIEKLLPGWCHLIALVSLIGETPPDTNRLSIHFDPGTRFEYSVEGYQYLAKVIAKIKNVEVSDLEVLYK